MIAKSRTRRSVKYAIAVVLALAGLAAYTWQHRYGFEQPTERERMEADLKACYAFAEQMKDKPFSAYTSRDQERMQECLYIKKMLALSPSKDAPVR